MNKQNTATIGFSEPPIMTATPVNTISVDLPSTESRQPEPLTTKPPSPIEPSLSAEPQPPAEPRPMLPEEAIKIIQKLLDGINPLSDEPLANKHLYLDSDIQRALQAAIPALERRVEAAIRQSKLPANAGKPWSSEEVNALIEAFDNGDTVTTLAELHQRTKGSITSRLVKLGKITT